MMHGFTKGVSVDVSYFEYMIFELNPPYGQSNFTVNLGPTKTRHNKNMLNTPSTLHSRESNHPIYPIAI